MSEISTLGFRRVIRTARRLHRCYDCGRVIAAGEQYAEVTATPRYDFNPSPGKWTRAAFCIDGGPR